LHLLPHRLLLHWLLLHWLLLHRLPAAAADALPSSRRGGARPVVLVLGRVSVLILE
jgi:hypothetical protein